MALSPWGEWYYGPDGPGGKAAAIQGDLADAQAAITANTLALENRVMADDVDPGVSNVARLSVTLNSGATGTQNLRLSYFTAAQAMTINSVRMVCGNTAAGATPTLIRWGLYLVAANGDGTLVASTANDTTLLAATSTAYTKSLQASYGLIKGQRYAAAILVVTSATAPTIFGYAPAGGSVEANANPRLTGVMNGQTDLPVSFLGTAPTSSGNGHYYVMLP